MRQNNLNPQVVSRPRPVDFGAPVFPSGTAGNGKVQGQPEDGAYQCKQCGFWNKAQEVASPGGSSEGDGGIALTDTTYDTGPDVTSGCALCGSYNSR